MLGSMKAAVLKALATPLSIETVDDPVAGPGSIVVDVVAAPVLPYAAEVFSGARGYMFDLPIIPGAGAVGRVRAVGPDATRLAVGDWVLCDPTIRSRDDALTPDITLHGLSARGEGGMRLQRCFHDGSFAEQMRLPAENVFPLGDIAAAEAAGWCAANLLLVPYGGLLAADLRAGETLLVSGATGNFGSAAVLLALAMGAGCVIAPGRNTAMLGELERRFGARVRTVGLSGDEAADRERMQAAAPGPIDCVLDLLPPQAPAAAVRAAAMTVREHGRIILMGGVGMLGGEDLALPYPWIMRNNITLKGRWMYPREAVPRMISMIRSGVIDLSGFCNTEFALADANRAVAFAASHAAPFQRTVIRPGP